MSYTRDRFAPESPEDYQDFMAAGRVVESVSKARNYRALRRAGLSPAEAAARDQAEWNKAYDNDDEWRDAL